MIPRDLFQLKKQQGVLIDGMDIQVHNRIKKGSSQGTEQVSRTNGTAHGTEFYSKKRGDVIFSFPRCQEEEENMLLRPPNNSIQLPFFWVGDTAGCLVTPLPLKATVLMAYFVA